MRRLGERGFASGLALLLLGLMLFTGGTLLYAAKNAATVALRYEQELQLRLLAQSAVAKAAMYLETGQSWPGQPTDFAAQLAQGQLVDVGEEQREQYQGEDALTCQAKAYVVDDELILDALAKGELRMGTLKLPIYKRARAHMQKGAGDGYVWLGWMP